MADGGTSVSLAGSCDEHDALGQLVPPRLHSVFSTRHEVYNLAAEIEALKSSLVLLRDLPGMEQLPTREICRYLEAAKTELQLSAPMAVCDCPPTKTDCPNCGGRRWLSGKSYHRISELETKSL
jgi:hypothetical protein